MKAADRERFADHFDRIHDTVDRLADELDPKRHVSNPRDPEAEAAVRALDSIGRKAREAAIRLRLERAAS